jgi:uncharacterized protein (TIGR02453 family)
VTGFVGFGDEAFEFYEGLRADNSKTYWMAHKHVYDEAVRAPMQALLDELAPKFDASVTLFRPYRDVRFSADKSPYKIAQGGYLSIASGIGFWMQLDADGVTTGGGFFAHDKEQTARYRASVDDDAVGDALAKLLAKLTKAGYEIGGSAVKTRPRGVSADHPRLDLMRHESLTVSREIPAGEPITVASIAAGWKRVKPLVDWALVHARSSS